MSNKKFYQMFVFVFVAAVLLFWSIASAVTFKIEFENESHVRPQYMKRNITPIHFKDNWNDFGWFLYFANWVTSTWDLSEDPVYIETTDGNDAVECMQMVKWFYYNAERGERLWPLDPNTAEDWWMSDLELDNWIYTRCHGSGYSAKMGECADETYYPTEASREGCEMKVAEDFSDTHGYYGHLSHTYKWLKFWLIVWTAYENNSNKWVHVKDPLMPSFIRYDNKYPVGFVYDYNGWAGFVWCVITGTKNISGVYNDYSSNNYDRNKLFKLNLGWTGIEYNWGDLECGNMGSAKNTLLAVIVDGLVWMSSNLKWENENSGIEWNQGNEKMQYFSSVDINNAKLINYARQKAENLCRWRWENFNGYGTPLKSLYCFDRADGGVIQAKTGTTIIVKWGIDVQVSNMNDFNHAWNYDIFVGGGDLIIDDSASSDLFVFKRNWFISNITTEDFKQNVNEAWEAEEYTWEEVAAWKFMKWNFVVNGKIRSAASGLENVYFVYWKLTSLDSVEDLKSTFRRKCNIWTWSDWNPCPISIAGWENPYENASLVIIDQNYPSPLYQ